MAKPNVKQFPKQIFVRVDDTDEGPDLLAHAQEFKVVEDSELYTDVATYELKEVRRLQKGVQEVK